jgi:hypothetical protein
MRHTSSMQQRAPQSSLDQGSYMPLQGKVPPHPAGTRCSPLSQRQFRGSSSIRLNSSNIFIKSTNSTAHRLRLTCMISFTGMGLYFKS